MWRIAKLSRRRCSFKRIWCTKTLPKFMRWLRGIPRSTYSWSIAETENFLIESMDQDLFRRNKPVEFSIRFCQPSSTSKKMVSATEISSLKMSYLMRTGMSSSLTSVSVARLITSEEPYAELPHTFHPKSSKRWATMPSWLMFGHLEWPYMPCSQERSLSRAKQTKGKRQTYCLADITHILCSLPEFKDCWAAFLWMPNQDPGWLTSKIASLVSLMRPAYLTTSISREKVLS